MLDPITPAIIKSAETCIVHSIRKDRQGEERCPPADGPPTASQPTKGAHQRWPPIELGPWVQHACTTPDQTQADHGGRAGQRTAVWPKCMPPIWMEKKLPAMPDSAAMVISVPNARPRFSGVNMSATSDWLAGNTSARPTPVHAAHVAAWPQHQLSAS